MRRALLLLCLACSGRKAGEGAVPSPTPVAPPATPLTTPLPAEPPPARPVGPVVESAERSREMCEAAIPFDARVGLRVEGAVVGGHMTCNLYREKNLAASVTADCARGTSLEDFQNNQPKVKVERIPDLGRGGWRAKSLMGMTQFYDGQVECEGKATAFKKGIDDLALARAFEGGLTPETAPKPPPPVPGEAQLRCDDVVSPVVRDHYGFDQRVEQAAAFGTVRCAYRGTGTLTVDLDCKDSVHPPPERLDNKRKGQKSLGRWKKDIDLGKGGFLEPDKVTFIDPETDCVVAVGVVGGKKRLDLLELGAAIERNVTPENIGRPPGR